MAISVVQRNIGGDTNGGTGSIALAFGSNVTAGNAIIAIGFIGANANTGLSTPTDTRGNTFNLLVNTNNGADSLGLKAWIVNSTGAGADTVTMSDGFNIATLSIFEVTGLASSGAFDKSSSAYQTSATSLSSGSTPTTGHANELLLGAFANGAAAGPTWTLGAGYSNLQTSVTPFCDTATEEQIVSATGAYAATASLLANSSFTLSYILTFSDTSGGGGSTTKGSNLMTLGVG